MRQSKQVIIDGGEGSQLRQIVGKGNGDLSDAVVADIESVEVGKLAPAQFFDISQLVLVHV